ncbi:Na+/alanine symporter (AlsT) (PDB:6CSE) [Commensalibacter communis]|uniref:Na+/alanine symporter (AlsT) n=1 Tax=Commensalibacter communis TaxID=2972786 RepID=A0A9W4TPG5_9PROT|nr:amino acid carrier protein [Commensalibacter communis]CAI3947932.1 Na+/alanine symporter (AlsT) (PDB:6CSE) [Commensalibacter communis]CAI3948445.1 Na+/alanine symporter (AlsT) (PDB:6CSE) [Commensalibacter communis]CAI3949457.1 Na+/alanine symporter (AlsT) (PDB:6CSE) [Commensalibacter communis]CAI3950408.1 Na+/alanine symporter (AlsT) (PDB:6CSE) [Commensalibacter communis]CAI3954290.1 Na+/alanine symporter (AlsT) (PDB:6CSE) [Commensalibacter communis]
MNTIFNFINQFFAFLAPITDAVWDFPTNIAWYKHIPILGQFSFPVLLLMGVGIYFTIRTRFIQRHSFAPAIKIMLARQPSKQGVSAIGSFMLGLAMRAGPGNIVGITGAISIGGPGALFWMWVAAFFGMASAFTESVLAQLFKEKKGDEFVGGLPFYGKRLLGNNHFVGFFLSCVFITYALFNIPAQTFNVFSAIGAIAQATTGHHYSHQSTLYYTIAVILVIACAFIIFGGIRRVVAYSDVLVPIKAVIFIGISIIIILINFPLIPYFFREVIVGAFAPHAIFGGAIGTALAQGVKRGLMSNEAGQGTITMAAAIANNRHPCEQGLVQSFGVFFDTMVICTMTGFIVIMAHVWTGSVDGMMWESVRASKITLYLTSVHTLVPSSVATIIEIIMCACYGLFAFTTLLGMISFAEISANFISKKYSFILIIRILGSLVFVPFGILTILAGLELGNLWYISDLMNIVMVYLNIPLLLLGLPFVLKALADYRKNKGVSFDSEQYGFMTECWNEKKDVK